MRGSEDVVQAGDAIAVVVTEIDRERRRLVLLPGAVG
ncbi:S1 RNA-binding domain-containing protein [Streptomyces yangpuensis]|nr:S1 RNA-binding domain-containing protein [Streptomyces yangpuensis]